MASACTSRRATLERRPLSPANVSPPSQNRSMPGSTILQSTTELLMRGGSLVNQENREGMSHTRLPDLEQAGACLG